MLGGIKEGRGWEGREGGGERGKMIVGFSLGLLMFREEIFF